MSTELQTLQPFEDGDIFVTAADLDETARFPTGKGKILQFAVDWTPKAVCYTGHTGLITSLTIDRNGNLHALDPQARARTSFGPDGKPIEMFANFPAAGIGSMIVLDDGEFLLGEHVVGNIPGFSGAGKVYRVDAAGTVIAEYDTETNGGMGGFLGVTHMALSRDGKTLFHVSETGPHVYAHDLVSNKRLGPVYTRQDPPPMVFGLVVTPDDRLLVAAGSELRQIAGGEVVGRIAVPEGRGWSVIITRPDGQSIWAIDFYGGKASCITLADDAVVLTKDFGLPKSLAGIVEYKA